VSFRICTAAALLSAGAAASLAAQFEQRATFRSAADLVSVAVIVRDGDGRIMRGLKASDFEVLDCGMAKPIVQFQDGGGIDARLAMLVDGSGSMVLEGKQQRSQLAAQFLLASFKQGDTATVFTFDKRLRRLTPFTEDRDVLRGAVQSVEPYGVTSMYDAIVGTVRTVMEDVPRGRAVLLLTDGDDTASRFSAAEAADAAAALDIPLYVLAIGGAVGAGTSPHKARDAARTPETLTLPDLARRTGGLASDAVTPAQLSIATRTILDELRHQYVIAIPAGDEKGWHELTVRVRRGRVQARSRNGYRVS
jgi:Ca-activated chloride channel family protein